MSAVPVTGALSKLVAGLPELYQPIYGHPELSSGPSRPCEDRLAVIRAACQQLAGHLGRPPRVLDLGCAQGYFALSLAADGAVATGVDLDERNVAVCRAIAVEQGLTATFEQAEISEYCAALEAERFDVVLGLSVLHHLCQAKSVDFVRALLSGVGERCALLLTEIALFNEPMYWAAAQPANPRYTLEDFSFIRCLGRFGTHLSDVRRPLYAASKRLCVLDNLVMPFWHATPYSHPMVGAAHQGSRWYFFGERSFAKVVRTQGPLADINLAELRREAEFLRATPPVLEELPRVLSFGEGEEEAWLVRDSIDGKLLSDAIAAGDPMDAQAVVMDVLMQLARLEARGLYHSDLRCWNVLFDGARTRIIDFGSIVDLPQDVAWPTNIFLSLFVFVAEVANRRLYPNEPVGRVMISPSNLPPPYRSWVARVWQKDPAKWSFAALLRELRKCLDDHGAARSDKARPGEAQTAHDLWMGAIERALSDLARHQAALSQEMELYRRAARRTGDPPGRIADELAEQQRAETEVLIAQRDAARLDSIEALREQLTQVIKERDEAIAWVRKAMTDEEGRLAQLERQLTAAHNAVAQLRTEHAAMLGEREALAEQISHLRARIESTSTELGEARSQREAAEEGLRAARNDLAALHQQTSALRTSAAATAEVVRETRAARDKAQEQLEAVRQELVSARSHTVLLEKEMAQLRATAHARMEALGQAQSGREKALQELEASREELRKLTEVANQLRRGIAAITGERQAAAEEVARFHADLEAVNRELGRARSQRDSALDKSVALRGQLNEESRTVRELAHKLDATRGRLQAVQSELDGLHVRNAELQHRLDWARSEIAIIRRSWSWRATAPARVVFGWLLRVFGGKN